MPTYEYECKDCGHTFEAFQSMSDEPIRICPQCGRELRRLIHGGTGVIFRGSGFYVTDRGKGAAAEKDREKKTGAETGKTETAAPGGEGKAAGGPNTAAASAVSGGSSPSGGGSAGEAKPAEKKVSAG
ncbi:MAG: zinc ribbon domain-containing protein [Treponema sp.]|jgi:putative FmdB family regulatory protein|nr:zinc ribbon domain-containing protein [Treponema sp.]